MNFSWCEYSSSAGIYDQGCFCCLHLDILLFGVILHGVMAIQCTMFRVIDDNMRKSMEIYAISSNYTDERKDSQVTFVTN
jgi:hypothetical protein